LQAADQFKLPITVVVSQFTIEVSPNGENCLSYGNFAGHLLCQAFFAPVVSSNAFSFLLILN